MADIRVPTRCDQCGQVDDHPKVNYADNIGQTATWHHDCLPARVKAEIMGSHDVAAHIIDVCEGGVRGDELLHHIEEIHGKA